MNKPGFATLAALVLLSAPLFAQFETAEVLGTVRDSSGGSVPRAAVTLLNQNNGIQARATTDENGYYNFFSVKVGTYTVTAQAAGFSKVSAADIVVAINARQRVDLTMPVGSVTETVQVTDAAASLETDISEHGQVIGSKQVVELPLNGRNYSDLALLSTNVVKSVLGTAPITGTPREGAFNANGMRSTYNNFLLDGMDNNAYSTSNQGFSNQVAQPSPDAVQEFKVITSNFSAEYGRVGGAVVNVVMRSGTNSVHGTAYEFVRNTDLNAIGYIFGTRPATFKKPTLQRNQFGLTVGGPIVKNKIFYFGDYEGFRNLQKVVNIDSLPTLLDRQGILPVTVVNPSNGAVYPAGSKAPLTTFAAKVLNDLPAPTNGNRSSNYQILQLARDYSDKYDAKVDGVINNKMTASLRFSQRKDNQFYQPDIPGPSGGAGNGNIRVLNQSAAAGYTWTVTPTSILEVRLSFTHLKGGKFPPLLGGASMFDLYGATGLPTASFLAGGLNTQTISGFNSFGRQATNPQFQNPTTWNPKINYSWNRGRHALKFGFENTIIHTEVMDINPPYGLNQYSSGFSKPTCPQLGQANGCAIPSDSTATTSYNLADFYFGLPTQAALAPFLVGSYRQQQYFAYAQDDYRVNNKLTVNLGMRWEFATPRWERDNVLTNFDPASNSLIQAKNGGILDRTRVRPDYSNWGPRVGLAYSIDPKTVFRGGYGISYVHLNRLGSADELGINFPQVVLGVVNQSIPAGSTSLPANFITAPGFPVNFLDPKNINTANVNIAYVPQDTKWPRVQTWFFSMQRELMKNTVIEAGYSGNHGTRLPIVADYNQASPNASSATCNTQVLTGCLGTQARRPNPKFGSITWVDPAGSTSYNSLFVRFEHRLTHGLYFLNSFTWAKALGNSEQQLESAGTGNTVANVQNIYNLAAERGPSSYDVKMVDVTSFVYQLPFGKGRQYGANWNPVVDTLLGGWELNTINTAQTGLPVNVQYTPNGNFDVTGRINDFRGLSVIRPNLAGDAYAGRVNDSSGTPLLFNRAAFQIPTDPGKPFGNLGRNALRGPNFWQWDLSVDKTFGIPYREGMGLQFRSEFFNVLNHTNFGIPNPNVSSASFGQVTNTFPARQIQLALKLIF
jgi:hypothetical protein